MTRFAKFSWFVLAYNIFVILFGAIVRATGSGAGCGQHWPLCNGTVIPRPERIETIIEFTHRVTSGFVLVLAVILIVWAWRQYGKGSLLRKSAGFVMFFTITEALVGAGLVLFKLVEDNDSVYRAISMMVHLVNTFLLVGSITVTAWWASFGVPERMHRQGLTGILLIIGTLAILLLGASGAVTALGDTLYLSGALAEKVGDADLTTHYLIQLRVYHPGIAVTVGVYLFFVTTWIRRTFNNQTQTLEIVTNVLFGLYAAQTLIGIFNVALRAPVWIQVVHLLVSNLIWISFVLLSALVFGSPQPAASLSDHKVHDRVGKVAN